MKPIIKQEEQEVILTSEITENHLVVAVIDNRPCILGKPNLSDDDNIFIFYILGTKNILCPTITVGNNYPYGSKNSIKQMVDYIITEKPHIKIEVFHKEDWKQALQWLIDNAE